MIIIGNLKNNSINQNYIDRLNYFNTSNDVIILPREEDIKIFGFREVLYGSQNIISEEYNYVLLGHYDMRKIDTDEVINHKVIEAINKGINTILCVNSIEVLKKDIVNVDDYSKIIIAFEEDELIGGDMISSLEKIRNFVKEAKRITNNSAKVVYGGGVNINNAQFLKNVEGLDGIILGTACVNIDEFLDIIKEV